MSAFVEWADAQWFHFVTTYESQVNLPVVCGFVSMMVAYWTFGLVMLAVDLRRKPDWLYTRRYQPNRPFSVQATGYNGAALRTLLINVSINQWFVLLPSLWLMQTTCEWINSTGTLPWKMGINVDPHLPNVLEVIARYVVAIPLLELFFYSSHRLLHTPWLYQHVHKIHHQFKAPTALASIYAHPFEAFFANALAVIGPAFVTRFHLLAFILAMANGWVGTGLDHSGFNVFGAELAGFHDRHHEFFNCNYGARGWLDTLLGTKKPFDASISRANASSSKKRID